MPGFTDTGIKCGNCKQYHESAAHVKLCFQEAKAEIAAAAAPVATATAKQESFLRKLLNERDHGWDATEEFIAALLTNRKATSASIDLLLGMPKAAPKLHADSAQELVDGVYRYDGTFYKVYHTIHGANVQVAKVLHLTDAGKDPDGKQLWNGEWEYLGKKPLYTLRPEHKLTQDEAKQFGLVYGMCCNCARDLTREESIHVGYGPTCAANNEWWYPTKAELKGILLAEAAGTPVAEPAWKAQVAKAEQDSMDEYMSEPF